MKKVISLFLLLLITNISIQAEDYQPILENFEYHGGLYAIVVGEESQELDEGTMWYIEVSNEGNTFRVMVESQDGDLLLDETLDNVTATAVLDDSGDLSGFVVTDDEDDDKPVLGFIYQDGLWMLFVPEEE